MATIEQSRNTCWLKSDLLFLRSSLEHGMTCAEVAGFLCIDEDEVRKKAEQMNIPHRRSRGARSQTLPRSSSQAVMTRRHVAAYAPHRAHGILDDVGTGE